MLDKLHHCSNWLLPRICVGCGFDSENPYLDLCNFCKAHLPWFENGCNRCGASLENINASIVCASCAAQPPPFDRLCALFKYAPPVNGLINQLKFQERLFPGRLFAHLLYEAVTQRWYLNKSLPQIIVPVPLHQRRLLKRGYNQAMEISQPLAKALRLPICRDLCQRVKNTPPQARLKRDKRTSNMLNAFKAQNNCPYNYAAIVDDVVTTGSTVRALSHALNMIGIQQIDVWCVCR